MQFDQLDHLDSAFEENLNGSKFEPFYTQTFPFDTPTFDFGFGMDTGIAGFQKPLDRAEASQRPLPSNPSDGDSFLGGFVPVSQQGQNAAAEVSPGASSHHTLGGSRSTSGRPKFRVPYFR
jgi:hypothetical protein